MKVEILDYRDNWQAVKDAAMNTIGKESGGYPSSEWKTKILRAEHSPIRLLVFRIRFTDIPYWVVGHFVRHKVGVEHFVSTQRTDRTGVDRSKLPQDAPVTYTMVVNAQSLINISRKRLCMQASPETRQAWYMVREALCEAGEREIVSAMVPECVYRGFCPELKGCGWAQADPERFGELLDMYREGAKADEVPD